MEFCEKNLQDNHSPLKFCLSTLTPRAISFSSKQKWMWSSETLSKRNKMFYRQGWMCKPLPRSWWYSTHCKPSLVKDYHHPQKSFHLGQQALLEGKPSHLCPAYSSLVYLNITVNYVDFWWWQQQYNKEDPFIRFFPSTNRCVLAPTWSTACQTDGLNTDQSPARFTSKRARLYCNIVPI